MVSLLLYDDERAHDFEPLVTSRPLGELLAGIATIRERWEDALRLRADGFIGRAQLAEFEEERAPAFFAGSIPEGCIVANTRFVPALRDDAQQDLLSVRDADVWVCAGRVAATRVRAGVKAQDLVHGEAKLDKMDPSGRRTTEIDGVWLDNVWDLIRFLPAQLASDLAAIATRGERGSLRSVPAEWMPSMKLRESASVVGDSPVLVAKDATIDPHVVFDARGGPILIARGAVIHSFTRIEGPCFIGVDSTVMQGRIATCAIGEKCKVSGEMSNTVILGFANKAHDGFLGHSYAGRWVNIGAGTITSNLKNTYGEVSIWTPAGNRATGMQFLGTLFGDHSRTGIGTMLSTGTVLGMGSNVFGGAMPPKYVAPFSWGKGDDLQDYRLDKFLEVAERVLSRRQVSLSDGLRRHYTEVHRATLRSQQQR
jgi:UDP-N-acetylglucosamine diphosphorylase/glucosamine-1-phosphate N-acetyltransferase